MSDQQEQEYPGIAEDGSLKKFPTPRPSSEAAIAASTGNVESLKSLSKESLFEIDEHGNSALIWAADSGHVDALMIILDSLKQQQQETNTNDASSELQNHVNIKGYLGNTALARATRGGHAECVARLIEHPNINPNMANEKMQYPLHFAAFKKHPDVVRILLDSGKCNTMVVDRKGRTPLEDTSVEEIKEMIRNARGKE